MAERGATPLSHDHDIDPPSSEQPQSAAQPSAPFRSGTYVVQVPKNQIYRVPPPENALIAERHRNPTHNNNNKRPCRCGSCCLCSSVLSLLILVLVVGLIAGFFSAVLLRPKNPVFYVERVVFKANSRSPEYDVTLRARNPNKNVGVLYQGGVAFLSFRQREIGRGNYPSFYQGRDNSTVFGIVFRGSNDVMKSQKPKAKVDFSLKMDVVARVRIGLLKSGSFKLVVACDLTVDTLGKGTRVLTQKCDTQRWLIIRRISFIHDWYVVVCFHCMHACPFCFLIDSHGDVRK